MRNDHTDSIGFSRAAPANGPSASHRPHARPRLRAYYFDPRLLGGGDDGGAKRPLSRDCARIAAMGFNTLLLAWPFGTGGDLFATGDVSQLPPALGGSDAPDGLRRLAEAASAAGLALYMDLVVDRAAPEGALASQFADLYRSPARDVRNPRHAREDASLRSDFGSPEAVERLAGFWGEHVARWVEAGVSGFRAHDALAVPTALWGRLSAAARQRKQDVFFLGWPLSPTGVFENDDVFDALPFPVFDWDGRSPAPFDPSHAPRLRIGIADDPFGPRLAARSGGGDPRAAHLRAIGAAALFADGLIVPMGFEFGAREPFLADADAADFAALMADAPFDLQDDIARCQALMADILDPLPQPASVRLLSGPGSPLTVARRGGADGALIALNPSTSVASALDAVQLAARAEGALAEGAPRQALLAPGETYGARLVRVRPVIIKLADERAAMDRPRIAIEAVTPTVDGGRFPAKRVVGDVVEVEADIFADGHEVLSAAVLWRAGDDDEWSRAPMEYVVNDRWRGRFPVLRPGRYSFAIAAWWDDFATFRRDLRKKVEAGLDVSLETMEGEILLRRALASAPADAVDIIDLSLQQMDADGADEAALLLSENLAAAMRCADTHPFATGADIAYPIEVDRPASAFAAWYELFPRSVTSERGRHGTFRDVIEQLPRIRAMGFDVLYFPPIHPIGRTNRKGPNNTLIAAEHDPGSPYAIGSSDGGHEAIHPELGSREDFRALIAAAREHDLEIALDFAIQCSPDHPWLKEHSDWFAWRPDGSMKYAENPPKKYQDIVNVDFYREGAKPALWLALRDVVQGWVDEGVRTFRVDNPHTKPFPFWEWMIADIRTRDPGVLFLSEAFTRPKVMYRLGKLGFSQSYTYFTWRETKAELTAYLTELSSPPARDVFRPHFFVNTPDINPLFLQRSGRAGFVIRAALAATLSGLWGVYSGFELCEAAAVPGKEEYLDSEKYEIRPRDYAQEGNIVGEISLLNRIRRAHPALQTHLGVTFYNAYNDQVLYFGKRRDGDADLVLVFVCLDPHAPQTAPYELPLWTFGLPDDGTLAVEDLVTGQRFSLTGKHQTIRLDPQSLPFAIWRVIPPGALS